MIVVKDVIYEDVPGHTIELALEYLNYRLANERLWEGGSEVCDDLIKSRTELVKGIEFKTAYKDESIVIGWTEHVQKTLGLPFQALNNLQDNIDYLTRENENLVKEVRNVEWQRDILRKDYTEFKEMSFWKRLRFLLKGINFKL